MTSRAEAQRGQVLAMMLLLLAALIGGFLYVFDSGQVARAKLQAVGAADAAAYGAAQWQARTLNDEAYLNRAMVANEVAIAQSVSLRSWSAYMGQLLQNASTVGSVFPPVGAALESAREAWDVVDRSLRQLLPPLETAASAWNVGVLSRAGEVAQAVAGPAAASVAAELARANLPGGAYEPLLVGPAAGNLARWRSYTMRYGDRGDERRRLREVVLASRDGFSARRDWTLGPSVTQLRKRGGTDLIGYDAWRGLDTLSMHESLLFVRHEEPLGWGGAEQRHREAQGRGEHGGSYHDNPRASRYAEDAITARTGYRGLPAFRDLAGFDRRSRRGESQPLRYEVALREPALVIATSDRALGGAASLVPGEAPKSFPPAFHRGGLRALAAARVEFMRPEARGDGRGELPSLFNPYWQARLAPVTRAQRLTADLADGLVADPYGLLP
jgi:hypothetical protein